MFQTTQTLSETAAISYLQNDPKLQEISKSQQKSYVQFDKELKDQQKLDQQNLTMIQDGIDLLGRMLKTEQENFRGEIDPVQTDVNTAVDDAKLKYIQRIELIKQEQQKQEQSFDFRLKEFQQRLQQHQSIRKNYLKTMKQEFIKSQDDLQQLIKTEQREKQEQYDQIQNFMKEKQNLADATQKQCQQKIETSQKESKEHAVFHANLIQKAIISQLNKIQQQLEKIQVDNQTEHTTREEVEEHIVGQMEFVSEKLKSNINNFIQLK